MPSEILFPHQTSTGPAPSYRDVFRVYQNVMYTRIQEGSLRPLVLPYYLYGMFLLVAYLCVPHTQKPWIYALRWPVFAVILAFEAGTIRETASWNTATSYAAGLVSSWGIVTAFTWLILYKPQWDSKRVERRHTNGSGKNSVWEQGMPEILQKKWKKTSREDETKAKHPKSELSRRDVYYSNGVLRQRSKESQLTEAQNKHGALASSSTQQNTLGKPNEEDEDEHWEYFWQTYPDDLLDRFLWVMDLLVNFRGPGWNWQIGPMPDMPNFIKHELGEPINETATPGVSAVGLRYYASRQQLFKKQVSRFVIGYFLLDIFKVTMMTDPYFIFGPNSYQLPAHLEGFSTFQLHIYRQSLSFLNILTSIEMAFLMSPVCLGSILGPKLLGLRGEYWYYVTHWGSFSNISNKGLNGLWGSWWHQWFRFGFAAPANYIIKHNYVKPRSMPAKLLAFLFAFSISGFLHCSGSYTQLPKTFPLHPPTFFILQAVGILVQTTGCAIFGSLIEEMPKRVRQAGNLAFAFGWLFWTSWWLVDDFARGGVWLYEPIPFSPLRGLGFGQKGDGLWCWGDFGLHWHQGKHWWDSGLAI